MKYTDSERSIIDQALNIVAEKSASTSEFLTSPKRSRELFQLKLATLDQEREHFMIAFLDNQNGLIANEVLFSGTINGAAVYPAKSSSGLCN